MILDRYTSCKGKLWSMNNRVNRVWNGGEAVVIKDVPAYICEQCHGDYWSETSKFVGIFKDISFNNLNCLRPLSHLQYFLED